MQNRQAFQMVPRSAAIAEDNLMILGENLRVHPDVLIGNGNGVFGSGIQGTGKTGIMVKILEQAAQFHVPMVVFDREGDILPAVECFPKGVVGTSNNCPTGKDVIKGGLQVIYDLSTWPTMDEKGSFVASMVNSLYNAVDALPVTHRTPCLIGLDEAALFLPQRRGEVFSVEVYKAMIDAMHNVATTGRKRGLTPVLFTQKISEVNKLVLSPGTYIMLKQVVHTDLKRYLDYIEREDIFSYMNERQICQFVSSLQPGRAIVKLANGEQKIVQFYERESQHISHTPQVQAALNLYANKQFNAGMRFGAYIGEDEEQEPPAMKQTSVKKQSTVKYTVKEVNTEQHPCEKCQASATYILTYTALRATAKGTLKQEKNKYYCSEHSNKQCKPL
jgi:hypothetical protein